ncbi:MAG TPA: ribosome biogenesis GTP-binding protein YihA/YsxC [Bacillota bacterium]|nr:ribosome biogenesis GTP-binding protein YihA/YsxC [Bacillota bacterium]
MKVNEASYIASAVNLSQCPAEGYPEVAFAGRSNVGKSSLLNTLVNRRSLARTSSKPGKTQTINFYLVNNNFFLVDLPGYGFAKVSKEVKATWGKMIEQYLRGRDVLCGVVQLVDIRHEPTNDDIQMYQWLQHFQVPVTVVATKADKISRGRRPQHLKTIKDKLQLQPGTRLIAFSAETREGLEEVWTVLEELITG